MSTQAEAYQHILASFTEVNSTLQECSPEQNYRLMVTEITAAMVLLKRAIAKDNEMQIIYTKDIIRLLPPLIEKSKQFASKNYIKALLEFKVLIEDFETTFCNEQLTNLCP